MFRKLESPRTTPEWLYTSNLGDVNLEAHNIIGIDVSMGRSNCAIYHSNQCLFNFTFTHTISGFKTLLSQINL